MTQSEVKAVSAAITAIESWESTILTKYGSPTNIVGMQSLSTNNGKAIFLLGGAAIMKYSYTYWFNARDNASNPWHDPNTLSAPTVGKPFWGEPCNRPIREAWADVKAWCRYWYDHTDGGGVSGDLKDARGSAQKASSEAAQ